jgi:adenosyl cobinamide kinase/adenosyl cobinamide phosphate guanylyltransferase
VTVTLVIGGTRSGKSEHAEALATAAGGPVTYVATAVVGDADFAARVEAHRTRRPDGWVTVEAGSDLPAALRSATGTALVDSLGAWVAAQLDATVDADALLDALLDRDGDTIVVTEEVGLSVHAPTAVGRAFVDALGTLNRQVAAVADHVVLVVAGRALALP